MSFLDKVPESIRLLEKENNKLEWSKQDFYHQEEKLDDIEKQIQSNHL